MAGPWPTDYELELSATYPEICDSITLPTEIYISYTKSSALSPIKQSTHQKPNQNQNRCRGRGQFVFTSPTIPSLHLHSNFHTRFQTHKQTHSRNHNQPHSDSAFKSGSGSVSGSGAIHIPTLLESASHNRNKAPEPSRISRDRDRDGGDEDSSSLHLSLYLYRQDMRDQIMRRTIAATGHEVKDEAEAEASCGLFRRLRGAGEEACSARESERDGVGSGSGSGSGSSSDRVGNRAGAGAGAELGAESEKSGDEKARL